MDEEIWNVFLSETEELTDSLEIEMMALERDGGSLQNAYRLVHTIKGNLRIVQLDRMEKLVHRTEDLFQENLGATGPLPAGFSGLVLFVIDLLRSILNAEGETPVDRSALEQFEVLLEAVSPGLAADLPEDLFSEEAAGGGATEPSRSKGTAGLLMKIDSRKLDEQLNVVGELITAGESLAQLLPEIEDNRFRKRTSSLLNLIHQLSENTLNLRMIPLNSMFSRFRRLIRDMAEEKNKQIRLTVTGEFTEVDKTIAEKLPDALTHLIRNAVDHGIESPEDRRNAGKEPAGTIELSARTDRGSIIIQVRDDGRGLDFDRILTKARQFPGWNGLEDEENLANLIFEPGFSTASAVTTISGRGVGMDAVRESILGLRGSLKVESERGKGTGFIIRLPLSLALIEGLLIQIGETCCIIPSEDVVECISPENRGEDYSNGTLSLLTWNGSPLPLINLTCSMGEETGCRDIDQVVIVRNQTGMTGLAVDGILNTIQTVIKPLPLLLRQVPWLQGTSVLGSGEPVLILDIPGLVSGYRK